MDQQIESINKKIKELKDKKQSLQIEEKENNKVNGNHVNKLIRVSTNFDNTLINIQNKRVEYGKDNKFVSKPKITELIIKHRLWNNMKNDLISFNFEEEEKDE